MIKPEIRPILAKSNHRRSFIDGPFTRVSISIFIDKDESLGLWHLSVIEFTSSNEGSRCYCPFDLDPQGNPNRYSTKGGAFKRWSELEDEWRRHAAVINGV